MAVAIFKLSAPCRPILPTPLSFYPFQKVPLLLPLLTSLFLSSPLQWSSSAASAAIETIAESNFIIKPAKPQNPGARKVREWKKLSSRELGISSSMISRPIKAVLKGLRKNGYEVYLVGGCVRDLILKRVPKDYDILTSAELREVMKTFPHSQIVGKRFPIIHVYIGDTTVEVSSISTSQRKYDRNSYFASQEAIGCDGKDNTRWRNCMQRDFTINGLMFDPFGRLVYDYMGGLEDIRRAKLRTIIPASISFHEDCARILRAIRIAARLRFRLARETAQSFRKLSSSILRLDKARLFMEMNYMLAYGSAEASLRLLWKYGLLEILLPHQAVYLVRSSFQRMDEGSNMLLALFANLDKPLAPDRPCHGSLWVAILAFHKALSDHPRDPSAVAAFALSVLNGGDISEAVEIARNIAWPIEQSFQELLEPRSLDKTSLKEEVMRLAASVKRALSDMIDEVSVSKAMAKYRRAPYSDMVFIPVGMYWRVCGIFECVGVNKVEEAGYLAKQGCRIDYSMLASGRLQEVRYMFARVVFDTLYPLQSS